MNQSYDIVFVLGAGSSFEVGMPLGEQLKHDIARLFAKPHGAPDHIYSNELIEYALSHQRHLLGGRRPNHFTKATNLINRAVGSAESIDNFMHLHKENEEIQFCGKVGIAAAIIKAETSSKIMGKQTSRVWNFNNTNNTWLNKALQRIVSGKTTTEEIGNALDRILFINFNYDRCLEHFTYSWLLNQLDKPTDEISKLCSRLNIIRPYGSLGPLPWQARENMVFFGDTVDFEKLIKMASQIKTFTEGTQSDDAESIKHAILHSKKNFYLGFAFHDLNMKLLDPNVAGARQPWSPSSIGTAYKMSESNISRVKTKLSQFGRPKPSGTGNQKLHSELTCSNLFDEYSQEIYDLLS